LFHVYPLPEFLLEEAVYRELLTAQPMTARDVTKLYTFFITSQTQLIAAAYLPRRSPS
jgi:hypothetical protein